MDFLEVLENKKVLYAEDEEGIRKNVADILELFFNTVFVANDGLDALDIYETQKPDIIIVDICMPKVDGLDVIKQIRKENKKIPIIVLSAHKDEKYLWRAVEQKISKYLIKPFDKEMFLHALNVCAMELVDYEFKIHIGKDGLYEPCKKIVTCKEEAIQLSKNESRLLEYFISRANQTVTFDDIACHLWGYEETNKDAIKSLIKEVRKKIGKETIRNLYGIGYIFEN